MMRRFNVDPTGDGALEALEGERVVVQCSEPRPPGSTLVLHFADLGPSLHVKVKACRQVPETRLFRIEGRTMNLSRADRERLESKG